MNSVKNQKTALFFDTNIALHYKRLDQINWQTVTGAKEVDIIVSAVILSELDKHKTDNFSKKLRKRAAEYSGWLLEKYSSPALSTHINVVFKPNEPQLDFVEHQLDRTIADDRLIAAVIEYALAFPEQRTCVATADIGLTLKLQMREISVVDLGEIYRLPEELDPDEVEIRSLRSQLARHTNRQPKLVLTFEGNEQILSLSKKRFIKFSEFFAERMEKIKRKHPLLSHAAGTQSFIGAKGENQPLLAVQIGQALSGMSHSQQGRYNSSLEKFYKEYEVYLQEFYDYTVRLSAQIPLPLVLSNKDGSAPATKIDIILSAPEGTTFITKHHETPKAPNAPRMPSHLFDMSFDRNLSLTPPYIPDMRSFMRENAPDQPKLSISDEGAHFTIPALKHKQSTALLPIMLDFESLDEMKNTCISYEIHADEMLEPTQQQLHLKLTPDASSSN